MTTGSPISIPRGETMSILEELCPICKSELSTYIQAMIPPINVKECTRCDRKWKQREEIVERVFNPDAWEEQDNDKE